MFRIKICGITCPEDAAAAVAAGAEALGLNFYNQSPRFVTDEVAHEIAKVMPRSVKKVGVFVNECENTIRQFVEAYQLDAVQLHGDESPHFLQRLLDLNVIAALRPQSGTNHVISYLGECQAIDAVPQMILIDAYKPGVYGGSGNTVDWNAVRALRNVSYNIPIILAGGLHATNVEEAIRTSQADAVDTASGVEIPPRRKCPVKMKAFVDSAKRAFDLPPTNC
jgi:phosphoribosylanthranilate isomerase